MKIISIYQNFTVGYTLCFLLCAREQIRTTTIMGISIAMTIVKPLCINSRNYVLELTLFWKTHILTTLLASIKFLHCYCRNDAGSQGLFLSKLPLTEKRQKPIGNSKSPHTSDILDKLQPQFERLFSLMLTDLFLF